MSYTPRFCTAHTGETLLLPFPQWAGPRLERDDYLLGRDFIFGGLEECRIIAIFRGEVDDEWSILFDWNDLESTLVINHFWAEVWYDHEDERIHCLVRRCAVAADGGERQTIYGPNPTQLYYRVTPIMRTLADLAVRLEVGSWDHYCDEHATVSLDAERARSRESKPPLYSQRRREAVAMALHSRLGKQSLLGSLGEDILREHVLQGL